MQLRVHPSIMRRSGMGGWPPFWINTHSPYDKPTGEIETLKRAWMAEAINNAIFLSIEHEGNNYVGAAYFDDATFSRQLNFVLQSQIGVSLKEIGDLDLSHTL